MRINLAGLLQSRPICHPTRITSTSISSNALRVIVHGTPWWRDSPASPDEQTIEFVFENIRQGRIETEDFGDDDEALEFFEIKALAEVDWAQPDAFSIFCSSPLKDPLKLYLRVHDFLNEVDAHREPHEFLNYASGRLAQFIQTTSSDSFLVGRGPECIRRIICAELENQGVAHNVIATTLAPKRGWLVRLGESHFLCNAAFAEFEEA